MARMKVFRFASMRIRALHVGHPLSRRMDATVVNVYGWSDYVDPKVIEDFTKETGITVTYETYHSVRNLRSAAAGRQNRL